MFAGTVSREFFGPPGYFIKQLDTCLTNHGHFEIAISISPRNSESYMYGISDTLATSFHAANNLIKMLWIP
jgi:hypothetical protein